MKNNHRQKETGLRGMLVEEKGKKKGKGENNGKYELTLYVAGQTPQSQRAINNIRKLLEEKLKGKYTLNIIDIFQQPLFAKKGQIVAAPTLIKELPPPLRRFIGNLSNTERIIAGLDIRKETEHEKKKR